MNFLQINPEIISFFGLSIRWYAVLIVGGAILAAYLATKQADQKNFPEDFISDLLFYAFPIGIIGARLYYVLFKLEDYVSNPLKIFAIWEGGIAIYGGLIAGVLVVWWYAKKRKASPLIVLDIITPYVLLAQAIGRWGNFINQEAFGAPVTRQYLESLLIPNFIIDNMNIDGIYYQPTFLYESVLSFIGFLVIIVLRAKLKSLKLGDITLMYIVWYGISRFFVEGMRSDSLYFGAFRISQLLSLVLIILSVIIYVFKKNKITQTYHDYLYKGNR